MSVNEIENKRSVIEQAGLIPGQLALENRATLMSSVAPSQFEPEMLVVDFGAGTVDAAYFKDDSIRDVATFLGSGDQCSRVLEDQFTVEFPTAELIKQQVGDRDNVQFTDMTGQERRLPSIEIKKQLVPILKRQVEQVSDWLDDRSVKLACLAGGGSRFPFLSDIVSKITGIPGNRIVNKPPRVPDYVQDDNNLISHSSDYTALGMLLLLRKGETRHYHEFTVNGHSMRFLTDRSTVRARTICQYRGVTSVEPPPESAVMVEIDGEWHTERWEGQVEPEVTVEGNHVELDYEIRNGDRIEIDPPDEPEPVHLTAEAFLPEDVLRVNYRGDEYVFNAKLIQDDGEEMAPADRLTDGSSYHLQTEFTRDEITREIARRGADLTDPLLWKHEGTYTEREQFPIGETVEIIRGDTRVSVGLREIDRGNPPESEPIDHSLD
ncbi:MAG: hypothetical protein ABEJ65_09025 [bacterium]